MAVKELSVSMTALVAVASAAVLLATGEEVRRRVGDSPADDTGRDRRDLEYGLVAGGAQSWTVRRQRGGGGGDAASSDGGGGGGSTTASGLTVEQWRSRERSATPTPNHSLTYLLTCLITEGAVLK